MSDNDNAHEVEAIVGHRRKDGRDEYLIKWHNTWEPASNLDEGSLKMAKAYCNGQKDPQHSQKPKRRKLRLKRKRSQESHDSDDDFICDADDSFMSDGTYHDQSVDDNSRAEKMPVTPSPQRPRRVCCTKTTTEQTWKTYEELSSDDDSSRDETIVKKRGSQRKIVLEESDDSDTSSDNENDNNHEGNLPPLPLSTPPLPNLSSSPKKLKTTSIQCSSTIDALGLGRHDLYCCPICYNEASQSSGGSWIEHDDDDGEENSDEEYEEDCFVFDDDPMTILGNMGSNVASSFCFLKMKDVRMHMQEAHSVDLGELKGNDLFKRFMIRSPDGLLQHYTSDMWDYWRDESNRNLFRNLVQLLEDNEDNNSSPIQSDFCTSFPNRGRKIWEKVSGPYLKVKGEDTVEEKRFINDDIDDDDANEVMAIP